LKFLFIIQGEGRGHMTQAISMFQVLEELGHQVCAVCIGKSERRQIPEFVLKKIQAPIFLFDSPNFVTDANQKTINLRKTIWKNLLRSSIFQKSLNQIDLLVKEHKPDVILNFYDILGGIYNLLYRPRCKFWVIGHQYLIHHPEFPFANGQPLQKLLFKLNTNLTSFGADSYLALSFRSLPPHQIKKLHVIPPLLRKEVKNLQPSQGDFFLAYIVNPGYVQEIISEAKNNPDIQIEAFWDKKDEPKIQKPLPNLTLHLVDDKLFLEKMAACKGMMTTAGFESVCEAMYLGKYVLMVPVQGQYEQECNAIDAKISGAGSISKKFDVQKLEQSLMFNSSKKYQNQIWINSFKTSFEVILDQSVAKYEQEIDHQQRWPKQMTAH
jgi:uncharacterized protein (TIGR00661 family)